MLIKFNRVILFIGLLFFSTVSMGCQKFIDIGDEIVIESSSFRPPRWTYSPPKKSLNYYYFVGIDESPVQDDKYAFYRGIAEVSQFLNSRAETFYLKGDSLNEKLETYRLEYINIVSKSIVKGVLRKAVYWEKRKRIEEDGVRTFYKYYVLLLVHKKQLKDEEVQLISSQIQKENSALVSGLLKVFLENIKDDFVEKIK